MPYKFDTAFFAEVRRLKNKFPKLTQAQAYKLADENINPKKLNLTKNTVVNPTGKLMPKGKILPANKIVLTTPVNEIIEVKEEKKGINIYLIIAAALAAYYFIFKKKR
jgi:hypothetical protein